MSIYELSKLLSRRKECKRKDFDCLKFARYLIEPTGTPSVEFNEMAEERLFVVIERFLLLLGEYEILTEEKVEQIRQEICKAMGPQAISIESEFKDMEKTQGEITFDCFEDAIASLGIGITAAEASYCIYIMTRETNDIDKLKYKHLLDLIKTADAEDQDYKPDFDQNVNKQSVKGVESIKQSAQSSTKNKPDEYNENFEQDNEPQPAEKQIEEPVESEPVHEENKSDRQNELVKSESQKNAKSQSEYVDLTEDQMIEIAQSCFQAIAEGMHTKGQTLRGMFGSKITKVRIENEDTEVLATDDFLNGITNLGIEGLEAVEQACLVKVLSVNDEEKLIKVTDLVQILEDYGIKENANIADTEKPLENQNEDQYENENNNLSPPQQDEVKNDSEKNPSEKQESPESDRPPMNLDYTQLDKVSMVLMLALTEYLIKAKVPLYNIFGNYISTIRIKDENENDRECEIVNAEDFFKVIFEIGIKTEDTEHENLQNFLALEEENKSKISVDKLKEAIEKFATDDKIRSEAHQCYMELIEGNEGENGEGEAEAEQEENAEEPGQNTL